MFVLSSPENNAYVSGNITFAFVARDLALKNASLIIGDRDPIDAAGITSYSFNTAILTDGSYTIKLVAYDLAGNKAETSITITIDNTPPDVQITSPASNAYVKGLIRINFTFFDLYLKDATLLIDGQPFNVTTSTYFTWNTTATIDRSYIMSLIVTDKAGNSNTDEITVTVDNTTPSGKIFTPLNSAYLRGIVNITFYGYDANILNVSLRIGEGVVPTVWTASGTYSRLWNTTASPDSAYTIKLEVYDKAGNQFTTSIAVVADNTLPTVSIVSPQDGAPASGTVSINFTVTDNNFPYAVSLLIDNAPVGIVLGQTSYQWDTTKAVDGNHTIKIVATDWAGNTKEASITVKVSNAPPTYITYLGYAAAGALGLALGALIIWLLLKKKLVSTSASAATAVTTTT